MKQQQLSFNSKSELIEALSNFDSTAYDVHFIFADKSYLEDTEISTLIQSTFKKSMIMGCSTAGEIGLKKISEGTFVITSVKMEKSIIKKTVFNLNDVNDSFSAGERIAKDLINENLKHIFVLSDGVNVNGTRLIEGINSVLDHTINVSGGLAGDNGNFIKTYVADNNNQFIPNCVSALGFYGEHITTSSGSYGGWDSFGIDRIVTKSHENVVYEIDGQPALELYKSYLGDLSSELPGSALFFPLEMRDHEDSELLVRTILGVNEKDNSLTFAGNIPEGAFVRLMKTNVNRVIDGAEKAADIIKNSMNQNPELVLMVSCVGRKLVLKQLTQDEIEAVTDSFNEDVIFTGFYSNGELSKLKGNNLCNLHNQTMTLTAISEI